jgi:hypothetical protein
MLDQSDVISPAMKYRINIHTGKEAGGDCDARVHLRLTGDRGTTGTRVLKRELQGLSTFTSAQVCSCHLFCFYFIHVACINVPMF